MQKIKMIALDLDGTTLNDKKQLTPRTKQVLEQAARQGIHIVVASGRAYTSLPEEVMALSGITYALTSNGSAVYDTAFGERCLEILMEAEKVDAILEFLREKPGQEVEVFYKGNPYVSEAFLREPTRYGAPERAVGYLQSTRTPVSDLHEFIREHRQELDSMDIISAEPKDREEWFKKLEEIGELYITSSVFYRVEVSNRKSGKGAALKKLAERLQIRPEEIVAFGNAENDVDMIQFAGTGVAVANSPEHVKQCADRIAPSNQEEGVAQVLEELLGLQ